MPRTKSRHPQHPCTPKGLSKLTFKYIWSNHLSKNQKRCALVVIKISNNNRKRNNTTIITLNVSISCLPIAIFMQFYTRSYWWLEMSRFKHDSNIIYLIDPIKLIVLFLKCTLHISFGYLMSSIIAQSKPSCGLQ